MSKMINNPTGIGYKEHIPTDKNRALVEAYSLVGLNQNIIAERLQINKETMYKYYRAELDEHKYDKLANVGSCAYQLALKGNEAMIKLILTAQAQWHPYKPPEQDKGAQVVTLLESIVDKLS